MPLNSSTTTVLRRTPGQKGARTFSLPIVSPGNFGLNTEVQGSILGAEWATEALNAVFDSSGRLSARKGWASLTSTPIAGTPVIEQIFEYIRENGSVSVISAANNNLFLGVSAPSNITGSATITVGNNWQFLNFADNVIGVQQGEQPVIYTGVGSFTDLVASSGTAPQGNCGVAAFGRLWIVDDDKQTIKYSGLLDETDWGGVGAGSIDMTSVWPSGMDEVVAISAFNGLLVVFGRRTIVMWFDGAGSELGINPDNIQVTDTIIGTGCIARDSVRQIDNGDIIFLSEFGVQSLGRLVEAQNNPIQNISQNIATELNEAIALTTPADIRSAYSPEDRFYIITLPSASKTYCFDTRTPLPDNSLRVTEWTLIPKALAVSISGTLYMTVDTAGGEIGNHSGYLDDGVDYTFDYTSGWLDLQQYNSYIKMLKRLDTVVFSDGTGAVSLRWAFDFSSEMDAITRSITVTSNQSRWGIFQWNIGTWGAGGLILRTLRVAPTRVGQYLKIGLRTNISGNKFSIQQFNVTGKLGRVA